jgi:hypothetical protein
MNGHEIVDSVTDAAVALMDGDTTETMYQLLMIIRDHRPIDATLVDYFKEMHRDEVRRDHYGDGAENCTYCALIRRLDG